MQQNVNQNVKNIKVKGNFYTFQIIQFPVKSQYFQI